MFPSTVLLQNYVKICQTQWILKSIADQIMHSKRSYKGPKLLKLHFSKIDLL